MIDVRRQFALPRDRVWLNASHQGPMPRRAAKAVAQMVHWKQEPHHLTTSKPFNDVPAHLRSVLARLLSVSEDEVALANSASYGIHAIANGLRLGPGDEVLVAANDFPSDILPWVNLEQDGAVVNQVMPAGQVLTADEVAKGLTPSTRVVCLTWVHSFSGQVVDLDGIGEVCRRSGVLLVVNGAQGVGGVPISPTDHPIDGMVGVGFKWLCGPYGTGFCWFGDRLAERLRPSKFYWLSSMTADDLADPGLDLSTVEPPATAARYDVFGTANFFNVAALAASAELVAETGVDTIHRHNLALAERLVAGIDPTRFEVQDRGDPERRSSIVFVRPVSESFDAVGGRLAEAGIDVARRLGLLRFSPHFYNTDDDIDRALEVLRR